MSALAKEARAAMKAKAHRMANSSAAASVRDAGPGDDSSKTIDLSGWKEPTMNGNAQTGMRPVSRRQFKSGGTVSGEHSKHRADRKARKNGGNVNAKINRDVREANAEIAKPHIGGFADGGATNFRKQMHGMMGVGENLHGRRNGVGKFHRSHKAAGGPAWDELPVGEDMDQFEREVEQGRKEGRYPKPKPPVQPKPEAHGGRAKKASGGSTGYADIAGMRPKGDRIPRAHGGRSKGKGKTNIIIGIHAGGAHQPPQMAPGDAMPPRPPMAPPPGPPPMPPQGAPPMGAGASPGMMPPNMPMPRKAGGRTKKAEGGGTKAENYWMYQPASSTPSLDEAVKAKAIHPDTTTTQWYQMSPGMRREIMRGKKASGGKVVGAKYPDASIAKAEKTKSVKGIPGGAGGLGRLAKASIARKDGFRPV